MASRADFEPFTDEIVRGLKIDSLLVKAADVEYRPPRWLIKPYFQLGKGTLIQGDNGCGKTAFACAVAAHVSTGEPILGMEVQSPGNVLMLSVEDDLPILRGRIEASGGDLSKCFFVNQAAGLSFTSPEIETAIQQIQAKLVIFDPFQAFLGAGVDMFRANKTRPLLAALFEMAGRNNCSVAIIAHCAKSSKDKSAVNFSLGSTDIPASMRSILHISKSPDCEEERLAIQIKCSNAAGGKTLVYDIQDRGGVKFLRFADTGIDDLKTAARRQNAGLPYEQEPLVQLFNQLIANKPAGGFWSYSDLKAEGCKLLGFPPFSGLNDLRSKLDSGLAQELQQKAGLVVVHSVKGTDNKRGIRISHYMVPESYQTVIN